MRRLLRSTQTHYKTTPYKTPKTHFFNTTINHSRHLASTTAAQNALTLSNPDPHTGVATLTIDCKNAKQNTMSTELVAEFATACDAIENDPAIKAVVLASAKPGSFVAGADVKQIAALGNLPAEAAAAASRAGQESLDRLAAMQHSKPWVAAIDGSCLGGGLEMALACAYRVASTSPKTVLGLPEVQLGLLPGAGGTQRLPKLVGVAAALDLMLTGKHLKPAKAKKLGLVDHVVDAAGLARTAAAAAADAAAGKTKPRARKRGWLDWALEATPPGRALLFSQAGKAMLKATKGRYPAPPAILECVKEGVAAGHAAGSAKERALFGELATTAESAALRGIFFGMTACKKNPYGEPARRVQTVGVLGAGLMGAGIAEVSTAKGLRVLLKDRDDAGLARGEGAIAKSLGAKLKKRRVSQYDHDAQLSRVVGLTDATPSWTRHFGGADLVIEAVFEEMSVKHRVIREMEAVVPPHCILASNTSTLPIGDIAAAAQRPQNVVGMHYFSPVPKMPLLEVIPHAGTAPEVTAAAVDVGIRQGKTVVTVQDVPGFFVNRCLGPLLVEAMALLQQGVEPEALNAALVGFGMPVGGVTLADEVGLDVTRHVVGNLQGEQPRYLGVRMEGADLKMLDRFVEAGLHGRKAGKGFFDYSDPKAKKKPVHAEAAQILKEFRHPTKSAQSLPPEKVAERAILRFVIEAVHCLESNVIRSARDGDIASVFGIGFPPFVGGPFMYIDRTGAQNVVATLEALRAEHGEQFAPPKLLLEHAKSGKPFLEPVTE